MTKWTLEGHVAGIDDDFQTKVRSYQYMHQLASSTLNHCGKNQALFHFSHQSVYKLVAPSALILWLVPC